MGEILQGRHGPAGPVVLVTLPCPVRGVTLRCDPGPFAVRAHPSLALDARRAEALLRRLGLPVTGRISGRGNLPPGGGAGASTAALVALARAAGAEEGRIAAACLAVEGATDPLMFADPARHLWASREGRTLARLPPLPPMDVVAGFCGPPQPTDPGDAHFPDVADLVATLPEACASVDRLAALASESARRTLALRGPAGDAVAGMAQRLGAAGFAIGHTGPARALLFRPGQAPAGAEAVLRTAGFRDLVRYSIGGGDA